MHVYIICIGSNYHREENLLLARKQLTAWFPSLFFAGEEETEPFLFHSEAPFTNQVACIRTEMETEQVKERLKAIERLAGRAPGDKEKGIVKLDIDLLVCDGTVLKAEDMERDYVIRGIDQIRRYI